MGKYGAYWKLQLQTHQYPNEYLSAFIKPNSEHANLRENDEILADVDNNPQDYNGRMYRNFRFAKQDAAQQVLIEELQRRVTAHDRQIATIMHKLGIVPTGTNPPQVAPKAEPVEDIPLVNIDDDINPEDLPF